MLAARAQFVQPPSHRWIVLFCANDRRVDATVRASLASINPFIGRRHAVGGPRDSDLGPAGKRGFLGPPTFTLRFADNKFGLPGSLAVGDSTATRSHEPVPFVSVACRLPVALVGSHL